MAWQSSSAAHYSEKGLGAILVNESFCFQYVFSIFWFFLLWNKMKQQLYCWPLPMVPIVGVPLEWVDSRLGG